VTIKLKIIIHLVNVMSSAVETRNKLSNYY